MCIQWRDALHKTWKLPNGSHTDLIPLIAECVPLDVALFYRFIKFYRTVALSHNIVVNYIANIITFAYRSTMGQNVRHMSKYNVTHHELSFVFQLLFFTWNFIICLICTCLWILSPNKDDNNKTLNIIYFFVIIYHNMQKL